MSENGWISVEEQLPPEDLDVAVIALVRFENCDCGGTFDKRCKLIMHYNGEYWRNDMGYVTYSEYVLYWCYIPKIPEGLR